MKKAVFTNSYNAKKAVAPVQKKAPDDKMKSPKTGNDSLMVIWTTMILAVLEKEKRLIEDMRHLLLVLQKMEKYLLQV